MVKLAITEHIDLLNFIPPGKGTALLINSVFPANYFNSADRAVSLLSAPRQIYDVVLAGGIFSYLYDIRGCFSDMAARIANHGLLVVKDAVTLGEGAYLNTILNIVCPGFVRAYRPEELAMAAEEIFFLRDFSVKPENRSYTVRIDAKTERILLRALEDIPEKIIKERQIRLADGTFSILLNFGVFVWEKG
jgi:hypothetical protein